MSPIFNENTTLCASFLIRNLKKIQANHIMPHRSSHPIHGYGASDEEWDISRALIPSYDTPSNDSSGDEHVLKKRRKLSAESSLKAKAGRGNATNEGIGEWANAESLDLVDVDGDDESFIAAQQAASNRKASNLKGRTVKKGGGFQAMGTLASLKDTH